MEASEEPTPDPGEEVRRMMSEVRAAVRVGDFESAWEAYRGVFPLALFNESAYAALNELCPPTDCPDIGQLAWLLGKSRSDLGFLDEVLEALSHPQLVESWRAYFEFLAYAYVGPDRRPKRKGPNEVSLYYPLGNEENKRPLAAVRMADGLDYLWAMVDTGTYRALVREDRAVSNAIEYRALGAPSTVRLWHGAETSMRTVVFKKLLLGSSGEDFVPGTLEIRPESAHYALLLGASLLLRYDNVCFALKDNVLYLGQSGPCGRANRLGAIGAHLPPGQLRPSIEIRMAEKGKVTALIDTGSDVNLCKASLAKALAGTAVKFGPHPLMAARCNPDWTQVTEDHVYDMVIGMETLWQFAAFGWELNPFRLYFVPREDEA